MSLLSIWGNRLGAISGLIGAVTIIGALMAGAVNPDILPVFHKEFNDHDNSLSERLTKLAQAVDQNQRNLLLLRFNELITKRERGGLTSLEQIELCDIGHQLGYAQGVVPGC